jgi:hypothetical protein
VAEKVGHPRDLGIDIGPVVFVPAAVDRHAFEDGDALGFERPDLFGIVRKQPVSNGAQK